MTSKAILVIMNQTTVALIAGTSVIVVGTLVALIVLVSTESIRSKHRHK